MAVSNTSSHCLQGQNDTFSQTQIPVDCFVIAINGID